MLINPLSDDYRKMTTQLISRSKPVAEQVQDILRERIQQGIYLPEKRIPSEEQLAAELQVSRATLRTALAALAAEGYIYKRQGEGTFVCLDALHIQLHAGLNWDIERQIHESGAIPLQNILRQEYRAPTPEETAQLMLAPGERVFGIERVFLAGDRPVAFMAHGIRAAGLAAELPLEAILLPPLTFMERFHTCRTCNGWMRFLASLADETLSAHLRVPPGSPLLVLESIVSDHLDRPLMLGKEIYRGGDGFRMNMTAMFS
jgi:DNA-binding GntR family transcriptional regulator